MHRVYLKISQQLQNHPSSKNHCRKGTGGGQQKTKRLLEPCCGASEHPSIPALPHIKPVFASYQLGYQPKRVSCFNLTRKLQGTTELFALTLETTSAFVGKRLGSWYPTVSNISLYPRCLDIAMKPTMEPAIVHKPI